MLIINPANGEILQTDDPSAYYGMGYRDATPEELDHSARVEEFGGFEAQAQAQMERVVRGATLGAVEGFGDDPEAIQSRADVSRELSPVTSLAADILPDVGVAAVTGGLGGLASGAGRAAARASLAEGAGLLRAGLAAGRAGGAAALAAESAGTGLVGAGQQAYAEEREFLSDDPGRDAENALMWGGLNFGLGSFMLKRGAGAAAARELDDIAAAAEVRAAGALPDEAIPGTPGQIFDVEGVPSAADSTTRFAGLESSAPSAARAPAAGADEFVALETQLDEALAAQEPASSPRVRDLLDRMRAQASQAGHVNIGGGGSRDQILDKLEQVWTADEKQVAHGYTHARFYEVNDALRGGSPMTPEVQADFDRLDSLFKKAVDNRATYSGTTLRGVGLTADEAAKLDTAGMLTTQGFMSSSTDSKVASQFTNFGSTAERDVPILFEIEGRSGVPIGRGQAEVVHRPGTQFAVLGKRMEGEVPVYQIREVGRAPGAPSDAILGSVTLSDGSAVTLTDLLQSPLGVGSAAAAGAVAGGALTGDQAGVLGGAAAGGALGMVGAALGGRFGRAAARGGRKLEAAAVRQGEREAVQGGVERALRNASKAEAADVVERAIGPELTKEADSFGRQRRLYINRKAIRQVATKEMQKDLTELVENVRQVASVEKQSAVATHVSDNLAAQRAVAKGVSQQAAEFAGQLKAEARAYSKATGQKGVKYAIPGQSDLVVDLMDHAKQLAKAPDGKGLFKALDDFRRTAQEHKLSLERGMLNSESAIHYEQLIPRVEEFASKLRQSLEDSTTWGKAGEMQRAYNGVIADRLIPNMKTFESAVLQRTHKGYDGLWKTEGWEGKIKSLLADADSGNRRHVLATLDAMGELGDVARKYGSTKQADLIGSQVDKVRRTLGLADELADAEERMHALGQIIGGGPLGGFLAGGLAGGLPGAVIGGAIPGAVRGVVMGDLIEAFQRLSGATDQAVQRGVDDWIRSSRLRAGGISAKLPKMPSLSDEAKQLRDVAMRRGITQSMALFMGEDSTPHAAYQRLQDKLLDGEAFFEDLSREYGTLQKEAPDVFMMLAARADGDRRFLLQRMPPNVAVSMANPDGYPPSRDSIEDWATYVNALRYPMRVARSIGSMRVQEAEALRERRPRVYELLQQRVIEGIQAAKRSGHQVDDVALAKINLLFPEVDGVASPVFSRELGQVVADYNIAKRERERGGGAPSAPPDKRGQLPAQAMAQQGATFGSGYT